MLKLRNCIFALCAVASLFTARAANDYGLPGEIQQGNILHLFCWSADQAMEEMPAIAEAGFNAIQISPVQGNAGGNAEWFYAYMPYDIAFKGSGVGDGTKLIALCKKAHEYGVKVIVDVVANHINKDATNHDRWWDSNGRLRWQGSINYGNRYSVTHGQLGDYGDVNSEDAEVQARAKKFVETLKGAGVDGIRWDAAKHIGLPSEGCNFWPAVTSVSGMYHYGEILDNPGGPSSTKYTLLGEYTKYMTVTDNEYSNSARRSGGAPQDNGTWTRGGIAAEKVIYWGESHDTFANTDGVTKDVDQNTIDRAWAIGACRNGETSLYLSRPFKKGYSEIRMGVKGSTHFTSPEIAAVNKLKNISVGAPDYFVSSNGVACVTRKGKGACIVVGSGGSKSVSIANGGGYVPAGTYRDQVGGGTFTVTSTTISGRVGSTGIAVIFGDGNVTPDPEPDPEPVPDNMPDVLMAVGNVNGCGWEPSNWTPVSMTKSDNTFEAKNITVDDAGQGVGYFSFITKNANIWDGGVNNGDRYGAPSKDYLITVADAGTTVPVTLYTASNDAAKTCQSWAVANGKYDMTVKFTESAVTLTVVKAGAGVDDIEVTDNSTADVYTLQGVCLRKGVDAVSATVGLPAGLYIVRTARAATKVLVK